MSACKRTKSAVTLETDRQLWLPGLFTHLDVFGLWLMDTCENFWLSFVRICVTTSYTNSTEQHERKKQELKLLNAYVFKRISYPKMEMLSLFTHPHVVPNPYDFLSSVKQKRKNSSFQVAKRTPRTIKVVHKSCVLLLICSQSL